MRLKAEIRKTIGNFSLSVNIESNAGRIGILGASGSGKSMALRSIAGIEKPDSGHIEFEGRVLYDSVSKTDLKPQKRNIGYMFQNYALFPTMSVLKNVCCGLKGSKEDKKARAMDMLRRMRLNGLEMRLPGELSGGQQQRVALARILVCKPSMILLDEPFSALDANLRDRMQHEMLELMEGYKGQVIMVSHNRDELYRFSQVLFVIKNGRVLRKGSTEDIFKNPEDIDVARMTGCKNFSTVKVTGSHTMYLTDWGIKLELDSEIPEGTRYIGYRAHFFKPVWGEREEKCLKPVLLSTERLPFEVNYYLKPAESVAKAVTEPIAWFVQENVQKQIEKKGFPDYLKIEEKRILFLK